MADLIDSILSADDLPTPPGIALQLLDIYADPNVTVEEIQQILSADPVLVSKLLEYCNSPLFACRREISSIQQGIVLVGIQATKILALSFSLTQTDAPDSGFDFEKFWSKSIARAVYSKTIAEAVGESADEAFFVGTFGFDWANRTWTRAYRALFSTDSTI